jgi:hypothetical protein
MAADFIGGSGATMRNSGWLASVNSVTIFLGVILSAIIIHSNKKCNDPEFKKNGLIKLEYALAIILIIGFLLLTVFDLLTIYSKRNG